MAKEPKKAKQRKIKDLEPDAATGTNVKGGRDLVPEKKSIFRALNGIAKPKN